MATIYVPRPAHEYDWQARPVRVYAPLLAIQSTFKPAFWKYNYDDSAFWVRQSAHLPPLAMPPGGNFPLKPHFWKYNYDDSAFWVGSPNTRIPYVDEPAGGGFPFKPPYWKYNYDDPGFWIGAKTTPVFQVNLLTNFITDRNELQNPVDYFLMGSIYDVLDVDDEGKKIKRPAFTVTTNKKGYS